MKKGSLIRTIYLYAFALLGLVLLIISGIRFLDMGLKAFIFTKADEEQRLIYSKPPTPYQIDKIEALQETRQLSVEENINIDRWLADYDAWKEQREETDPITSQRQRTASSSLAMIFIGLPLYLYHWSVIKKES
jgi:hypothetical protein